MYSIKIRDHVMIAHSLNDALFGPAQKLHGATYIVDVTFYAQQLNKLNVVIDIADAHRILQETLDSLNYSNLDELPQFKNTITSVEFLAKYIHDQVKTEIAQFFTGKISVTLGESHISWATYEGSE